MYYLVMARSSGCLRPLVTIVLLLLLFLPGCSGLEKLLSSSERAAGGISGFELGAIPVTMTLQQEVGELLAQPLLVLSRNHDGMVQIQNSAGPVDPNIIPFRAPLLALFSCPIQPTLPRLSQR